MHNFQQYVISIRKLLFGRMQFFEPPFAFFFLKECKKTVGHNRRGRDRMVVRNYNYLCNPFSAHHN